MSDFVTIILAAGKGTRMKSALPKVLHKAGGKAMVQQVLDAAKDAGAKRQIVVTGFGGERVREALEALKVKAEFVTQEQQLGTGHAVKMTAPLLKDEQGTVMVLCGDTPLLTSELLKKLFDEHVAAKAKATVLTAVMPDATGYGRIIRKADGSVEKIVEHKDATEEERKVREVNSGIYCFDAQALFSALEHVTNDNAQGEYYLTDVLQKLNEAGAKVGGISTADSDMVMGINSRKQLSVAEGVMRQRILDKLMDAGVTIMDPASTFIEASVKIGRDTVIYPYTWLEGTTEIGEDCEIGPNARFTNVKIGDDNHLQFIYGHDCEVKNHVTAGPYVHLRPDTVISDHVKIGNYVEVKNSNVGEGTKLPHLTYIGDSDIGSGVNMGCGCITVNYDGKKKHRTVIGDNAFVGCNTNLVAPVPVQANTYLGAGSTITKEVPENALGIARARQKNIEGWAEKYRNEDK